MTESARLVVTVDSTQVSKAAADLSSLERSAQGADQASQKLASAASATSGAAKNLGASAVSAAAGVQKIESAAAGAFKGMDGLASAASKVGTAGAEAAAGALRIDSAATDAVAGLNSMAGALARAGSAGDGFDTIGRNIGNTKSAVDQLSRSSAELDGSMAKAGSSINAAARALDSLDSIGDVDSDIEKFNKSVGDSKDGADEAAEAFDRFKDSADSVQDVTPPTGSAVDGLTGAFKRLALQVAAFVSVTEGVGKLVTVQRQFDVLNAGLLTATGSTEKAAVAFGALQAFAEKTPYGLDQAGNAFIKLVNLGLTPSERAMTSYGNTAAAMGKDLIQLVEAVADATTGEFERLKDFGIKAKADGEEVSFVFRGVTKTIGNNAEEIERYLMSLGEVEFASAMAERAKTLDGAISALGDTWDKTFLLINRSGAGAVIRDSIDMASAALAELNDQLESGQLESNLNSVAVKFSGYGKDIEQSIKLGMSAASEIFTLEGSKWEALIKSNVENISATFGNFPENVRAFIQIMTVEVAAGLDKAYLHAIAFAKKAKAALSFGSNEAEYLAVGKKLQEDIQGVNQARMSSIEGILKERDETISAAETARKLAQEKRAALEDQQRKDAQSTEDRLAQFKVLIGGSGKLTAAEMAAAAAGSEYLKTLDQQLVKLKDKTALDQANTLITEKKIPTESALAKSIRERAMAIDAQKAADKGAADAASESASATKKAASEELAREKALAELVTQSALTTASTNAMADAYLGGADNVRALTIQQKIEEELLKTGAAARDKVAKAINDEADARDRLAVGEMIAQMRAENSQTMDLAKATLQGQAAIDAFNVAKQVQTALIGKNIAVGSKEYDLLLEQTKAQLANNKALEQASKANDIVDRLNPQIKALRDYTSEQEALTRAMELHPEKADLYRDALVKLCNEYEVNRSKATIWGQMTEAAVDRIDGVFADAWANIGDGAGNLWDNLKRGFKQTLGEIAHMLTTKPLLNSFANWLTGTDNGQGLGSVWGKLLGSIGGSGSAGGSSSGGGLWSGALDVGKNLVSAWNAITGVGASATAGFASGGITGAISGIGSYYGGMFSSALTTLSGGFSSLVSALGINTAATTAAATATGTGFGLGGTLVSGGVGSATYAAGASGLSAALSSAAAMWPLAVIMGMYQSGKLYDAGVRPSGSEMMDNGGSTFAGKAAIAPIAIQSSIMELTDKINGSLIGGKLAAIISGSTVHQAVWGAVAKELFGTGYQTKDSGISLGVEDGIFDAQSFVKQKKKGGLLSGSSKTRFLYGDLEAEIADPLGEAYNTKILNSLGFFSTLGVKMADTVLDSLDVATVNISTQGRAQEDIQAEIDKWFSGLGDSAVNAIAKATGESSLEGYSFQQLELSVNTLFQLNNVLEKTNNGLLKVSVGGLHLAERLAEIAGGMEQFTTITSAYYAAFVPEAERADDVLTDVGRQFKAMNVAFPETRDGFRKVVEALDLSTLAGQNMYVSMMNLATGADAAYQILESRVEASRQAMFDAAGVTQSALQRSVEAEKKAAQAAYDARVSSINDMLSTAQEAASSTKSITSALDSALKALRGTSDESVRMLRAQAKETVQSALSIARAGGSLASFTGLEDALSVISSNDTDLYASLEDFNREQGRNANLVAELNGLNGKQLSSAEQTVKTLQEQLKQAQQAYEDQVAGLDAQLEYAQQQMDALNGVDNSVKSVADAVKEMNAAVVAAIASITGKITPQNAGTLIDSIYQDQLGRPADAGGKAYWQNELATGNLNAGNIAGAIGNAAAIEAAYAAAGIAMNSGSSYWAGQLNSGALTAAQLQEAVRNAAIANGQIPAFASGGFHSGGIRLVGENGPELELTGASRIFNASQTAEMLRGIGETGPVLQITRPSQIYAQPNGQAQASQASLNADLLAEVRQLRQENKQAQFQIAKNTQRVETLMRKWDEEGTPQERDYA